LLSDGFFGYFFSAKKVTESWDMHRMQECGNAAKGEGALMGAAVLLWLQQML